MTSTTLGALISRAPNRFAVTSYAFDSLRRTNPAAVSIPVPRRAMEEGSGTAGVDVPGVLIADIPVWPAAFIMSAAK